MTELCPVCGRDFSCGAASSGCWCTLVELSETDRAGLNEEFEGCLCPDCLQRVNGTD